MSEHIEGNPGDDRGRDDLASPPQFFAEQVFDQPDIPEITEPIEVQIEGLYETEINRSPHQYIVLTDGEIRLPISIGTPEAKAILDALELEVPDRPMTHDLLRNVIDRLGATVERVVIDDLWRDVYYAKIYLLRGLEEFMIDARPSDAIAVAARFAAPIFVQSKILEVAGKEA